jgi:deoxycytidine triphosphate deaminase
MSQTNQEMAEPLQFVEPPKARIESTAKQPETHGGSLSVVSAELGQSILIRPLSFILATTLEFVKMPRDLMGVPFSRASLGRVGVVIHTSNVEPGFEGKLILKLS